MQIFHQSVFEKWLLKDKSVQACITSPPYYQLRKYDIQDVIIGGEVHCNHKFKTNLCGHCGAWQGQYGLEPSPDMYLEHTLLWLKEVWRVLKDDGIIFIVIDDSYAGSNKDRGAAFQGISHSGLKSGYAYDYTSLHKALPKDTTFGYKRKSKLLIPERLMVAMSDTGWVIRNNIRWLRSMPESVTDRFAAKSETIIFATKNPKYYFNLDAVRTPIKASTIIRYHYAHNKGKIDELSYGNMTSNKRKRTAQKALGKIGQNRSKTAQPPKETGMCSRGHYLGGGICDPNGTYKTKIKDGENIPLANPGDVWLELYLSTHRELINTLGVEGYIDELKNQILAETDIFPLFIEGLREKHYAPFSTKLVKRLILCSSKAGDTVLDPFCGSGTTSKVAEELNRESIGIDLGYQEIQKRRLSGIQKELLRR